MIQGTASEAVLVAMVAARHRRFDALGVPEAERAAMNARLVVYTSTQAHSSIEKAAMIAGITRKNVRLIETDAALAMDPAALRAQMDRDSAAGLIPFFLCATVGTTSTAAVDPIAELAQAAGDGLWLHIDAAYAGAALVCEEFRWAIEGVERADSFNFNPHKWLLVNFDCSCLWVRDRSALIDALSITPEYLRNAPSDADAVIDYRDWQVPLGRRFRALKLWLVMRHYGLAGMRAFIREHVRSAERFEACVRADDRFEVVAKRRFALVCFRLKAGDEQTRALLESLNATGEVYFTHTVVPCPAGEGEPVYTIRCAIGAVQTTEADVDSAWGMIREHAGKVVGA